MSEEVQPEEKFNRCEAPGGMQDGQDERSISALERWRQHRVWRLS